MCASGAFGGIINADAFQVYRQVSVGVASPGEAECSQIPHHLYSFLDCKPRAFNAAQYRALVEQVLADPLHWVSGGPLFVGGSLFYVRSLFFKLQNATSFEDAKRISRPDGLSDWKYLCLVDPVRGQKINPNDTYRIERALDVYLSTGVLPSSCAPVFDPVSEKSVVVWVDEEDSVLRAKIRERVQVMLRSGWVEEVEQLIGTPFEEFARQGCALGYDDVYQWIVEGKSSLDRFRLAATLEHKTWDYVRRQRKFWRSFRRALAEHPQHVEIVDKRGALLG